MKYADETSWKLWGQLCWLWAAATSGVAAFVIHARRGAQGLAAILGDSIDGIVHSDRWHVYLQVPEERRQLCWAHLKRDFRKIVECGGPSVFVGRRGLRIVEAVSNLAAMASQPCAHLTDKLGWHMRSAFSRTIAATKHQCP